MAVAPVRDVSREVEGPLQRQGRDDFQIRLVNEEAYFVSRPNFGFA